MNTDHFANLLINDIKLTSHKDDDKSFKRVASLRLNIGDTRICTIRELKKRLWE